MSLTIDSDRDLALAIDEVETALDHLNGDNPGAATLNMELALIALTRIQRAEGAKVHRDARAE